MIPESKDDLLVHPKDGGKRICTKDSYMCVKLHITFQNNNGHPFADLKQHVNKSSLSTSRGGFLYYVSDRKPLRKVSVNIYIYIMFC